MRARRIVTIAIISLVVILGGYALWRLGDSAPALPDKKATTTKHQPAEPLAMQSTTKATPAKPVATDNDTNTTSAASSPPATHTQNSKPAHSSDQPQPTTTQKNTTVQQL